MITAVDTNVLIDVFGADPEFGEGSREALRDCLAHGGLIACEVVWAEVAAAFPSVVAAQEALRRLGVGFSSIAESAALAAGTALAGHRRAGGARSRVIADFLIGAHAAGAADRLLTRDRGFYRRYFESLEVLGPSSA